MKSGTASKSELLGWKKPSGGKTGTTNDAISTLGSSATLPASPAASGQASIRPQTIGEKAYGSTIALPIWIDFMKNVPEGKYAAQPCRRARI